MFADLASQIPRIASVLPVLAQMAIRAVPRRRDFYDRIAQGASHEELDEALTTWLAGLDSVVIHMKTFLEQGNYGKV